MKNIELVIPKLNQYSYEQKLESDPKTMSYNAGYNVSYFGYHYDTGCIDFPKEKWKDTYNKRINENKYFAYIKDCTINRYVGYVNYQYNKNDNIYTGVCIDTASTLGMCGERNAIANMITNGENEIIKLVCVDSKGNVGSPCGACREYMMQLSKNSKDIEILKDIDTKEIVRLEELIPDWWGKERFLVKE